VEPSRGFDPWAPDEPPPSPRFGAGCLIALIVSGLGIAIAAVLVVKALAGALSGVTL
jgi:hypothetical protein